MDQSLADRLLAVLASARTREATRDALHAAAARAPSPHLLRTALAQAVERGSSASGIAWPAVEAARTVLCTVDTALDRALTSALSRDPVGGLIAELSACQGDPAWCRHALEVAWHQLSPPAARAAASLVDLLRSHPLGPARVVVYSELLARNVDVRGPLADDAVLGTSARTTVLCALASRWADAGLLAPIRWDPDPRAALLRAAADWPRHATHPRQLFYWFRQQAGLQTPEAYRRALLEQASRVPAEVRSELLRECGSEPYALSARPIGPGRWECGRCGDRRVAAGAGRLLDSQDPSAGAETEYACVQCGMRFFTAWERAMLGQQPPEQPMGFADP
jgi:hypothetical protein